MAYISVFQGFIFIEGNKPNVKVIGNIEYDSKAFHGQLKNLNMVKKQMAKKAYSMGTNAIKGK